MNALVKKEIRLLLPSWGAAMLLAMVQGITRPYDFYIVTLLFFGLTIMALTTIGRETSLNTFSSLLAQPAERIRLWQIKLTVLAVAFVTVLSVWLAAFGIAFITSNVDANDRENSYYLFVTVCLIAAATFTGGLWTTLLLRQLAGAFWLTLLVPAVLAGFSAALFAASEADGYVISGLCVVIAIYSVGGFLLARRLFFRAQDVGWTGGIIALPELKLFAARSTAYNSTRQRKPIFALLKKEIQLQQVSLLGAAGLLVLHLGIIGLRTQHKFARDSAGEILTSIFWMLWLALPMVIGSMAVAEERRLGVMEGQLCLPVSRRLQFVIKGFLAIFLGTLLGGVMPTLLEETAYALGTNDPMFGSASHGREVFDRLIVAFGAWLALLSFFASSLARNFLQAVGYAIGIFIGFMLWVPVFTNNRMFIFDSVAQQSMLPLVITVPTVIVTLLLLAYWNFKNFRTGWLLWRRNLLGLATAFVFVIATSSALYHRAWEFFEPAEPAHGPAKFSLANPPLLHAVAFQDDLQVQLPDGRVWFDQIGFQRSHHFILNAIHAAFDPFPGSIGPRQFLNGSNWVSAVVRHLNTNVQGTNGVDDYIHVEGYLETVGVQADGTLWVSDKSDSPFWTEGRLTQFGTETNWLAVSWSHPVSSVLLLKKDGTLWRWGAKQVDWHEPLVRWPALRQFQPYQIGTNADWKEISINSAYVQKAEGSTWLVWTDVKKGKESVVPATNYDQVDLRKLSQGWDYSMGAKVRHDGTLWFSYEFRGNAANKTVWRTYQCGAETNWESAATIGWMMAVALKSDGTLWQFLNSGNSITAAPIRLGIHNDWVAIAPVARGALALAADGGLWFWPYRGEYQYPPPLLQLPKQPKWLGNILSPPS
jgi:ABC-type transport system involved in multi-copper enzyme maturation permease subunit